jgi:RNA polymerase sigma-70 factor (sigma-E family)
MDFADYVARRRPALLRAAVAIGTDRHSAEDLLHSALARVFVHWPNIRDHRAADAYVRRAMANLNTSWHRQKWRSAEVVTEEVPEPDLSRTGTSYDPSVRQELWPLVMALPPRQRAAIALRYYEGLTEAETAQVLQCSIGTIKSNTSQAMVTLRRLAKTADAEVCPA